jgi:predicted Na+-dependent transporter
MTAKTVLISSVCVSTMLSIVPVAVTTIHKGNVALAVCALI